MTESVVAITTVPSSNAVRHGLPERELDASRHSGRIDTLHREVFRELAIAEHKNVIAVHGGFGFVGHHDHAGLSFIHEAAELLQQPGS